MYARVYERYMHMGCDYGGHRREKKRERDTQREEERERGRDRECICVRMFEY